MRGHPLNARLKRLIAASLVGVVCAAARPSAWAIGEYIAMPAGKLASVLASDNDPKPAEIAAFWIRTMPVSNGEFLAFIKRERQWQRDRVSRVFAEKSYLSNWHSALFPGDNALADQPVTNVSWFAAQAFCESEGSRLPTWLEWEYVAAADASQRDARADPDWRRQILSWYSQSSAMPLRPVGGAMNVYGVRDIHGLVWEWVDDFNALLVSADSRNQGDPDKQQFCGAGAISLKDRNNYAVLMRIALLSSLSATDTTRNLGFRCARPASGEKNEYR